jgi:hypothetical protein
MLQRPLLRSPETHRPSLVLRPRITGGPPVRLSDAGYFWTQLGAGLRGRWRAFRFSPSQPGQCWRCKEPGATFESGVLIGVLENRVATNHFLGFREWAVGDANFFGRRDALGRLRPRRPAGRLRSLSLPIASRKAEGGALREQSFERASCNAYRDSPICCE